MSFQHIIWQERSLLVPAAHLAILQGLHETWRRFPTSSPQEPDFVAGLVLEATPVLWTTYNTILRPHQISISLLAIYCHQTPRVQYSGITKKYTEVGDLLLVHAHRRETGTRLRNALLYQAKMSSKQPYRVPKGEEHQLTLYTDWPEFEYVKSPPLSGEKRAVLPNAPHSGAQYLLIDDRPPGDPRSGLQAIAGTYPIGSCLADTYLHDHNDLASEIVDFLRGRSGRCFAGEASNPSSDGWSQVVWDLIRASVGKVFNRRKAGWPRMPRIAGAVEEFDGAYLAQASSPLATSTVSAIVGNEGARLLFSQGGPPDEDRHAIDEGPPETGISLILLETAEAREEERYSPLE